MALYATMESDPLDRLGSPELKLAIIELLPKPTLKNARLVSKQWRDTTDIVLWARISTDLTGDDKRKMDYILDSKSCGILDNLKSLTITTRSRDLDSQKDASTSLLRLLVAIPPDNLASFVCTQFRISRHVAGSLIRLQSKLSVLSICVDDPTSAGIPGTDYVTGNLSKLHTIAIHSVGDDIKTYEGYRQWFPHMPGLRDLAVKGQMRATRNDFSGWVPHPSAPLLRLRSIILVNLRLLESSESMSSLTNLNFLKMLEFRKCQNVAPLLTSLARAFEENGSVLTHFLCSARQFPNEAVVACQRLFRSVTTLIWIDICVDHANALPSIESLESNFESLELLAWSTIDSGKGFALSELELLTRQCPRLEQLYVGLGDLRGSIDTIDASEHFDIRNTNDHINLLSVIGRMKRLHTLGLTDQPLLLDKSWRYQEVANEIFEFLAQMDSGVDFLQFDPASKQGLRRLPSHQWPCYSYSRGTLSTWPKGRAVRTVALPKAFEPRRKLIL